MLENPHIHMRILSKLTLKEIPILLVVDIQGTTHQKAWENKNFVAIFKDLNKSYQRQHATVKKTTICY